MAHDSGEMTWSYFDPQQPLVPGALGILEPVGQTFDSSILSTCDIIVMPALAVDSRGYRLGKGAGYYDRALVHTHAVLLAAVYPWEYVKDLPYEHHDKPVDGIVTGESVTWISQ